MRIVSTDEAAASAIKICIIGHAGAGKTFLASTIKESVLVVSAESGLLTLKKFKIPYVDITVDDKGEAIPEAKRIARLAEVYKWLQTAEPRAAYKWIFIDSLTEIAQNMVKALDSDPQYSSEKMALKKWGQYNTEMKGMIKAYRDLPYYNVVFTALAEDDKDESTGMIVKRVMMPGKISQQVPAWFDEVFYLGTSKDAEGNDVRKLLTSATERIPDPKDRSGNLDKFEQPDLAIIINKIRGGQS